MALDRAWPLASAALTAQTAFLWFGPLQIDMVFHLFFLCVLRIPRR